MRNDVASPAEQTREPPPRQSNSAALLLPLAVGLLALSPSDGRDRFAGLPRRRGERAISARSPAGMIAHRVLGVDVKAEKGLEALEEEGGGAWGVRDDGVKHLMRQRAQE